MTRKQLSAYIAKIAKEMHLEDWTFTLADADAEGDALAQTACVYGQKHANIWISPEFWERTRTLQRHVVVHELLHSHFAAQHHMLAGDYLKEQIGIPAHDAFFAGYNQQHEYGIDACARVIAKHLPLPPP